MCVCPSFLSKAFYVTSSVPWTFPVLYFLFICMYTYGYIHVMGGQRAAWGLVLSHLVPGPSVLGFDSMQAVEPALWPCFYSIVFSLD